MPTETDSKYLYTTKYLGYNEDTREHVQKTVIIPGQTGKQIRIDKISLLMSSEKAGVTASAMVTAEVAGVDHKLEEWSENKIDYIEKSTEPVLTAAAGESVTIRFHLKTWNAAYKARMKDLSYTYSLVDVEEPPEEPAIPPEEEDKTCLVVVECASKNDAEALAESLQANGAIVYIKK